MRGQMGSVALGTTHLRGPKETSMKGSYPLEFLYFESSFSVITQGTNRGGSDF